jgi:hypothetical protein
MELFMKLKFNFLTFLFLLLVFSACGGGGSSQGTSLSEKPSSRALSAPAEADDLPGLLQTLDELAEIERSGSWFQGLALTESGIREKTGDYAGAVVAAFKELAWAYGRGLIQKAELEQGLLNVLTVEGEETVTATVNAILAFINGQWESAATGLSSLFNELDEPDGFGRWMLLVCLLEKNKEDRRACAAYKAIRARYTQFPEYWYRGAKAFSGTIAAEFAESCINSAVQGPFAEDCRKILASNSGLRIEDGLSIKTKREIDAIISQSVNSGSPQFLDSLFPLISLPDNPYTVYAIGALRAVINVPKFRDYFNGQAASSSGRLTERLSYLCRI